MLGRGQKLAILAAATAVVAAIGLAAVLGNGQASSTEIKVSQDVLQATADGGSTSFVVYLDDQADVSKAYEIADRTSAAGTSTTRCRRAGGRDAGPDQRAARGGGRLVQVVLGRRT